MKVVLFFVFALGFSLQALASPTETPPDATFSLLGFICLGIFVLAYTLVIFEEKIHLRKSKPVLLAASLIWILIGLSYRNSEHSALIHHAIESDFLEFAELFFFLLVAMTYINAMLERGVFAELRRWLVSKGFSYRSLFWLTGALAFCISPVADNLTTALIMCAVVMAVGEGKPGFVSLSCINIVVAANAGGAFSPFGDITTLMVWQAEKLQFSEFFSLLLPSIVNFVVPAFVMQFALPKGHPPAQNQHQSLLRFGGIFIVFLFLATIVTAVSFHNFLDLPPVFGMLGGLAFLKFFGFYMQLKSLAWDNASELPPGSKDNPYDFDVFNKVARAEWDTLFFFYGVIMAVGGLGFLGYLHLVSVFFYGELGATTANILVGLLSAIVDNIPVMFAVLSMDPEMSELQWLLVTLTAGVGGSLLSIGSAAGVALMGQARGIYTFFGHLKWTPIIALGYAASIATHFFING